MGPTKVVHITTVPFTLRYLCLGLLRNLQDAGYEVFSISSPGDDAAAMQGIGIRHISLTMTRRITPLADLCALWGLYKVLRRERVEIVHTHTPKANLLGHLAARLAGVPVRVSTVHGLYFTSDTPAAKRTFFHIIESWSAKFADTVFLVNREDLVTVRSRRICLPSKIRLLGNGIGTDLRRFNPDSIDQHLLAVARARLGLPEKCKVVGFVGRLVAEKGLIELLQAARELLHSPYSVRFLIIGPEEHGKDDAVSPELARRYGVEELCLFTGARDDMPDLYGLMDLLVLPSHREGCSRVLMEASAMRLPCIVSDVRGCREVVQHERNGLVVPKGDVRALVAAIRRVLDHPGEARAMGESGRRLALERFDELPVFEKIKKEYVCLLKQHGFSAPEPAVASVLEAAS